MADSDDEFVASSGDDGCDFEIEDDEQFSDGGGENSDPEIDGEDEEMDMEEQKQEIYYQGKAHDVLKLAVGCFEEVVELDMATDNRTVWGLKSLKNTIRRFLEKGVTSVTIGGEKEPIIAEEETEGEKEPEEEDIGGDDEDFEAEDDDDEFEQSDDSDDAGDDEGGEEVVKVKEEEKLEPEPEREIELFDTLKRHLNYHEPIGERMHHEKVFKIITSAGHSRIDDKVIIDFFEIILDHYRQKNNMKLWFEAYTKFLKILLERVDMYCDSKNFDPCEALFARCIVGCTELRGFCDVQTEVSKAAKEKTREKYIYVISYECRIHLTRYRWRVLREKAANPRVKDTDLNVRIQHSWNDLDRLYNEAVVHIKVGVVITDSSIIAMIRVSGGLLLMKYEQFANSYGQFFESFKHFVTLGNKRRYRSLQYLVVNSMMQHHNSEEGVIDPFHSQDVLPYKKHQQIKVMADLMQAFISDDYITFDRKLRGLKAMVNDDPFFVSFIEKLRRAIQLKVMIVHVKPYRRVKLEFLAKSIRGTVELVESLCADLILDDKLNATIDQVHSLLVSKSVDRNDSVKKRHDGLMNWTKVLKQMHGHVVDKIE